MTHSVKKLLLLIEMSSYFFVVFDSYNEM